MTQVKSKRALQATGQARSVPMTRKQLLEHVAIHFSAKRDQIFRMPLNLEHMSTEALRAMPVAGHMFAEVETALNTAGVATDGTMGSTMDPLGFSPLVAHIFCGCGGSEHDGHTLELTFKSFAQNA